jgi:methionyl-tRNA formyltransferase
MNVVIAGKNNIAVECCQWLLSQKIIKPSQLFVIFNQNDNGIDGFQYSFKKHAFKHQLNAVLLEDIYSIPNLYFFSLEYDRIISPKKFTSKKLYNIHFSLLPKYRGMYTSAWPILNNETSSGVTIHEIDAGIDTGDIISQQSITIEKGDTSRDLYLKYIENGISLFKKNVMNILSGKYESNPQNEGYASYYAKSSINYSKIIIQVDTTAQDLVNQVRAFNFKEFQLPMIHGVKITRAHVLNEKSILSPGTVLKLTESFLEISTQTHNVRLIKSVGD